MNCFPARTVQPLHVEEKESWVRSHGGGSPRVLPAATMVFLEKLRRERNERSEQKQ